MFQHLNNPIYPVFYAKHEQLSKSSLYMAVIPKIAQKKRLFRRLKSFKFLHFLAYLDALLGIRGHHGSKQRQLTT